VHPKATSDDLLEAGAQTFFGQAASGVSEEPVQSQHE
jgi:hypothetical protein